MDTQTILKNIKKYNEFFLEQKDLITPENELCYIFEEGKGKIVLTAPHAVRHIREGAMKKSDYCTGVIVKILKDLTDVPILYLQYKSEDPNYYDNLKFKEVLRKYVLENDIQLVFDIHGAARSRPWDIDIGTMYGESLFDFQDLPNIMTEKFKKHGIMQISYNFFSASKQHTVTNFVAGLNVDSVQIEINREYRCDGDDKTIQLIKAMKEIIEEL